MRIENALSLETAKIKLRHICQLIKIVKFGCRENLVVYNRNVVVLYLALQCLPTYPSIIIIPNFITNL